MREEGDSVCSKTRIDLSSIFYQILTKLSASLIKCVCAYSNIYAQMSLRKMVLQVTAPLYMQQIKGIFG